MAVDLPSAFGWVVFAALAYGMLIAWMAFKVGQARKRYKVPYPKLYAIESETKDANMFNCIQRGHQNTLEGTPVFLLFLILGGLQHPIVCAILGVLYSLLRYLYFTGYSTGVPENRGRYGIYSGIPVFGLMFCTFSLAWDLVFKVPNYQWH